jgi:hypothetical protein
MGAMRREGVARPELRFMHWRRKRRPRLSVLFDAPRDGGGLEPSDRAPPTPKETAASLARSHIGGLHARLCSHGSQLFMVAWEPAWEW